MTAPHADKKKDRSDNSLLAGMKSAAITVPYDAIQRLSLNKLG